MLCGPHRDRWRALSPRHHEEFRSIMLARKGGEPGADAASRDWSEEYMQSLPIGEGP